MRIFRQIAVRIKKPHPEPEVDRRTRALWQAVPDAIFEIDREGTILHVIPPKNFRLHKPVENYPGKTFSELLPGELAQNALRIVRQVIDSAESQSFRFWLNLPDGNHFFEARLVAISNQTAMVILREATQQAQAEQELRFQEELYHRIVEDMPALVCRFLPDGTLTFVNQLYCQYFNLPKEELEGKNFFTFIPEEEQEGVRRHYASLDQQNPVVTYTHQVKAPDGSLRWQRWTDRALFDDLGRAVEYQSIGTDITQSHLSQLELESTQNMVTQTLRAANAGAWEWDIKTNHSKWSDENFLVLGLEPGSIQPSYQSWYNCIHPDDRKRVAAQMMNAIEHRANLDIEFRVIWPDHSVRWLRSIGKLGQDAAGEPEKMIGIQIDITAQKQIEQEIRSLNEQLEQRVQERTEELQAANRDLEAFAYSVSHDLRAPLRGVAGYARLLKLDFGASLPSEAHELLEKIQNYSQLMSKLIDDLLNFSRLGRKEITLQPVNIKLLAQTVLQRLLEQEKDRQIEVQVGDLPPAQADTALLEQVLVNLLNNALKYTRHKPVATVEVGWLLQDGRTVYFVRDNGVGFDMEYADQLFGVFKRLHPTDEFEGTGIGLANVKRIIERHGGKVWAQAEVNRGATFYFTL
jgi:PAS domain S-box-containing protein